MSEEESIPETPQYPSRQSAKTITFSLNIRTIWLFLALIALCDIYGLMAEGMTVPPGQLLFNIEVTTSCLLLSGLCTRFLKLPALAEAAHMIAVIYAFMPLAGIANYLAAGIHRPLIDAQLATFDHTLGLNWLSSYLWVKNHPQVEKILSGAYYSLMPQFILLFIILNWRKNTSRGWEMLWLSMLSCMICILVSLPWPAAGAFHYYHISTHEKYVSTFMKLHEGIIKIIGNKPLQGVIQFPSFHTALAVTLAYAARNLGTLSICYILINILVAISAPYIGGHHFTDILGGLLVALVTILIVRFISTKYLKK